MTDATPQAALLTDDEVAQRINLACTNLFDRAGTTSFRIARSIEQAILAKLQATQEPVHAGELPAFEQWWRQRQLLTFPKDYDQSRLADWGVAYKPSAKDAWQARAALSARKPLTPLTPDQIEAEFDKRNGELERIGHGTDVPNDLWDFSIGAHFGIEEFCRINGIGLEVKP